MQAITQGKATCTDSLGTALVPWSCFWILLCSHSSHFMSFTPIIFILSDQLLISTNIPQRMGSCCFLSSQVDSSMFCRKTAGDFCQTVSLAAGSARLVLLLECPENEKKKTPQSHQIVKFMRQIRNLSTCHSNPAQCRLINCILIWVETTATRNIILYLERMYYIEWKWSTVIKN